MAATRVVVNLSGQDGYDVRIGEDLLGGLGDRVMRCTGASRVLLVSDSNVAPLYMSAAKESLQAAGCHVIDVTIPAGEPSKSIECATDLWQVMADHHLGRDCAVLALGGGVVGDISGFIAATYLRGVPFIQVPTSLLAMVDASVGGKTAIDLAEGKNLVGAFKQPAYVCADTKTLQTLPTREWACGFGEIAKTAMIDSDDAFFWLDEAVPQLIEHDPQTVHDAITRCVVFKANVVSEDEFEQKGVRECLNYGHTLGHAIEVCSGFGHFSHGHAVAEGMRFAARLGAVLVGTPLDVIQAQDHLLDALGLTPLDVRASVDDLVAAMYNDKKVREGALRFVLPIEIGEWVVKEVPEALVREHLDAWRRSENR